MRAYHEFMRLKVLRQIREGCENERTCYIDPQDLSENEGQKLRTGLEASQRIAAQSSSGHAASHCALAAIVRI